MSEPTKPSRPFGAFRVSPRRVSDGVWITHPETGDKLRIRKLWCAEHVRAYEQAAQDYDRQHGDGSSKTKPGEQHCEVVAMATGLIVDWAPMGAVEARPYDSAMMASLLADPEYSDLRVWVTVEAARRHNFQPDNVAGN